MSNPQPLSTETAPAANNITFNVFLHGLFCIIDHPYGLDVLLPQVPEHSYRAGAFLGETSLLPRPYDRPYILRVPAGAKRFEAKRNLSVRNQPPNPSPGAHELHARIAMPLPSNIFYTQPVDLSGSLQDPGSLLQTTIACIGIILQYQVTDASSIYLEGHPYVATTDPPAGGSSISLHIFSEEDFLLNADHRVNGFDAAINLLPGVKSKITLSNNTPKPPAITLPEVVPGTIIAEYANLETRTLGSFLRLGTTMRSGNYPSLAIDGGAGSDVHTCTTIIACNETVGL